MSDAKISAAKLFVKGYAIGALKELYEQHISLTSAIGIDRLNRSIFENRLDDEIDLISKKATAGTYRFSQYKEKLISKGAGKHPRVISIPTFRDRITLRALCNVLRATYADDLDTKLSQHTIEGLRNELKSGKFKYFIKLDVTSFYPSIDHGVLRKVLKQKVRKLEIRRLIDSAIQTATVAYPNGSKTCVVKGVPQGLSISNVLAEIYLSKFDKWARRISNVAYFRYVDDILILTKKDPSPLFANISSKLKSEYQLTVHDLETVGKSAIGLVEDQFQFLGYDFKNGSAGIKIESIRRLEASLAKIFTTYKYRQAAASALQHAGDREKALKKARVIFLWRLNLRITGCLFEKVRRGWVFYFSQIDETALKQLHHLDKTVRVLAGRFSVKLKAKEVKSFARTYHETERSNLRQRYIPNFDTTAIPKQREILEMYGVEGVAAMSDIRINREFKRRIRRETSELELDIQGVS